MAPDQKKLLEEAPEIRLWYAKTDIPIFELYFKTMKYTNESLILNTALVKSERRIKEIFIEEKQIPDTFRKFKHRLFKIAQREAIKEMLINRQRMNESTKIWLSRISKLIPAFKELSLALFFIRETSLYRESRYEIETHLEPCKNHSEMQSKIKYSIIDEKINENKKAMKPKLNKITTHGAVQKNSKNINFIAKPKNLTKLKSEISISIYQNKFLAILDTGSEANIINEDLVIDQGFKQYSIPKITLKSIMGPITETDKAVDLTIAIEERLMHITFLVVKTEDKKMIIIGNETLLKLQQEEKEIKDLMKEFPKVFDMKPSEGYKGTICNIETKENKKVHIKQRSIPQAMQKGTKEIVMKMLTDGVVEISNSSWCNPIRPVLKPNNDIRLTVNMQFLNNLVEDNEYTLPHIQKIYEKTQGQKWFTIIVVRFRVIRH